MSARRHERLAKQQNELQDNREELEDQLYRLKRQPDTDERKQKILETNQELLETNQELLEAKIKLVEAKIETLRAAPNSEEPEIQIQILNKQIELLELQISSTTDQEQKNQLQEEKNQLIGLLRDEKNRLDRLTGGVVDASPAAPKDDSLTRILNKMDEGFSRLELLVNNSNSEQRSMSKAPRSFTHDMLREYGVDFGETANREQPDGESFTFNWAKGEETETPAAIKQIKKHLKLGMKNVELINARKRELNLHVPGKKSAGHLDGLFTLTQSATFFGLAIGGLELKTNKADWNILQMYLETLSLSLVSSFRQGVAVLGTDLNKRWVTLHFDRANHILVTSYACGHTALLAFKELLKDYEARYAAFEEERERVRLQLLEQIPEHSTLPPQGSSSGSSDQDLSGTEISPAEAENLEQFQRLQAYAAHLSSLHGCDLHAPSWGLYEHSPMSQDAHGMFG